MRTFILLASIGFATACSGALGAAQQGGGQQPAIASQAGQRSYDATNFAGVSAVGPNDIVISVGPAYSVRAEGPAEMLDLMEVVVEDGDLKIRPRRRERKGFDWLDEIPPATYYVTLPTLEAAAFAGSGRMTVDRVEGESFSATLAGSGEIEIAALAVDDADFSLAGSGDLVARGNARRSNVSIAGSGKVRTSGVTSDTAAISIVGSGEAGLTVNGDAQVSMMGSGKVDLDGTPQCSVTRMGGGSVRCGAS